MYPKLNPWAKLEVDEETGKTHFVDLLYDTRYVLSDRAAALLRRMDGKTDPYTVDCGMDHDEIEEFLHDMEDEVMIYSGRVRKMGFGTCFIPLYVFPEKVDRAPARTADTVMALLWLPLLILGLWLCVRHARDPELPGLFLGMLAGLLTGMVLHELSHSVSAVACGGRPFEAGIMFSFFRPCGYVSVNDDGIRSKLGQVRFCLAGVRMNVILFGLFLIASRACAGRDLAADLLFTAGLTNLILGILNMAMMRGVDGCTALGHLMGNEDYVDDAAGVILSRKRRRKIRSQGLNGHAAILAAALSFLPYLTMPAVAVMLIRGVLIWFR